MADKHSNARFLTKNIALGRIGGAEAAGALSDAEAVESDDDVLQAIAVAQRMKPSAD